ncbi:MAG: PEP-CTERM sorting domain-containing protein [Anaerohalosphaera sp.]|nr:PEP-CTERM sorting domain-containing protein [Anaerohalosphaera sp.]
MKKYSLLVSILIMSSVSFAGLIEIRYSVENVFGNQWVYNYTVTNLALDAGVEEFTIWFEHGNAASLQNTSDAASDTDWDQITWQPNEALLSNGGFDALARNQPIMIGESVSGFAVSFLWDGSDEPGKQFYEVVNPDNPSDVLDSGFTVPIPEPTSLVLMFASSICLVYKKRRTK